MNRNAHRSSDQIEAVLRSTREQLTNDLDELSRRVREVRHSVPVWIAGIGVGGMVILFRRPLARALGSFVPVAVPIVLTRLLERAARRNPSEERSALEAELRRS